MGKVSKKGENMEGIITWNIFTSWFFNRTLSIYVTGFPYENISTSFVIVVHAYTAKLLDLDLETKT